MRETNGARLTVAEDPATPRVAPRFTRAAEAERLRLKGRREQLLHKREAVHAELGHIDRAVAAVDELLELLAPLLAGNGSEPEAADDGSRAVAVPGMSTSDSGEARERQHVER